MAKSRKRKKKSTDELGTENEFMKLKMMAEFGGKFMGSENIPPEVENQFLKRIISFHKKHENSGLTTVYKLIGEPEYNHVHDLTDKEITKELKRLFKLMNKVGIALNVLSNPSQREVYRFITEELFKQEIEDVKVKGWINQFIYEDFHPNPEYEVKSVIQDCLFSIFNKGQALFEEHFSEDLKDGIGLSMDIEDLKEKVDAFWNRHYNVKLKAADITYLKFEPDMTSASAFCEVTYLAQSEKGKRSKSEKATAELVLNQSKDMSGWWEVARLSCSVLR